METRAVIFDIGEVLSRLEDPTIYQTWAARLEISDWQLAKAIFDNPVSRQAMIGKATVDDMWLEANKQLSLSSGDLEELKSKIWDGNRWDTDLLDFARSLRPQYKTAVLSNAWTGARESMQEYISGDTFDEIVYSCEEGIQKPNQEIYKRTLNRLDVAADEAIFIDDRLPNIEAAQQLGMQAIHFSDSRQVRKEIEQLLLLC